jgi:flavodoxin
MSHNLVLYFSVYGTTRRVAEQIARQIGADTMAIEPVAPYDPDRSHYDALARLTKAEHDENVLPAIAGSIDISGYDTVFVGYPMWRYTMPMILYTFFEEIDFAGKTIAPFNTHMGSGDGGTYRTIAQLEPGATVLPGLPVEMGAAEGDCSSTVSAWLERIGINAVA